MSRVNTPQRRGLEALLDRSDKPFFIRRTVPQMFYCWDGTTSSRRSQFQRIYLAGISRGVGTCSDEQGVSIAVFTVEVINPDFRLFENESVILCQAAALTGGTNKTAEGVSKKTIFKLVANAVSVDTVYFKLTDKKSEYTLTV